MEASPLAPVGGCVHAPESPHLQLGRTTFRPRFPVGSSNPHPTACVRVSLSHSRTGERDIRMRPGNDKPSLWPRVYEHPASPRPTCGPARLRAHAPREDGMKQCASPKSTRTRQRRETRKDLTARTGTLAGEGQRLAQVTASLTPRIPWTHVSACQRGGPRISFPGGCGSRVARVVVPIIKDFASPWTRKKNKKARTRRLSPLSVFWEAAAEGGGGVLWRETTGELETLIPRRPAAAIASASPDVSSPTRSNLRSRTPPISPPLGLSGSGNVGLRAAFGRGFTAFWCVSAAASPFSSIARWLIALGLWCGGAGVLVKIWRVFFFRSRWFSVCFAAENGGWPRSLPWFWSRWNVGCFSSYFFWYLLIII